MRILIDTNILISLEDYKALEKEFYLFYEKAVKNKCEVFYHKACIEDISKDKNKQRQRIIKAKLKKYSILENPATLNEDFSLLVGEKNDNDRIDNVQLYQLYKNYVELFVTNDKGIKTKARKIQLAERVLTSKEALEYLDDKFTLRIPTHPVIDHLSVRDLEGDFDSTFFESLKNDYKPNVFMDWIEKCAQKNRKCYVLRVENELSALMIYKLEKYDEHKLKGINKDAIKICTLKVNDDALGLKLGELFLNKMFEYCLLKGVDYLYITTYEKQKALIYILEKFGFEKHQEFRNNVGQIELKFLKYLDKTMQIGKSENKIHPYFRENVNKYVVPIQPQFYKSLFKDGNLRPPTLFDSHDYGLHEVQGNTIIKAYISRASRQDLKPNDLLFFYSSQKYKTIEPLGVLIEHSRVNNLSELWEKVKSKTVYSLNELEDWLNENKYLTVTIFRLVTYLKSPVNYNVIRELECYRNKFQSITQMTTSDYKRIRENHIDESFIID